MKLTLDTQGIPKRTIDLDAEDSALQLIKSQLEHLNVYRNDGREPSQELLEDIDAYERMVAGGNELCKAYLDWRHSGPDEMRKWTVRPRDFFKKDLS